MVQLDGANFFMCDLEEKKVCCCTVALIKKGLAAACSKLLVQLHVS